jgi:uncharacterized protein (TIGR02246 family)
MFFDRTPPGRAQEIGDLMMTRRAAIGAAWGPAMNLGHLQSTHWAASVSADGKGLVFCSTAPGGVGGNDLWEISFTEDKEGAARWKTVTDIFAAYADACRALDAKAFAALWDERGIKYLPGAAPIEGRAAIEAYFASAVAGLAGEDVVIATEEVTGMGDRVLARGIFRLLDRVKGTEGQRVVDGWFVTEFKRQADGGWKIALDAVGPVTPPAAQ